MALALFGWIMSSVLGMRAASSAALLTQLEFTTAFIEKMLEPFARVWVSFLLILLKS